MKFVHLLEDAGFAVACLNPENLQFFGEKTAERSVTIRKNKVAMVPGSEGAFLTAVGAGACIIDPVSSQ
jgi:hypothetical protein